MVAAVLRYARVVAILTVVWIILQERIDLITVAGGALVATVTLIATNTLVLKASYRQAYHARPIAALAYAFRLLSSIYIAGFQAIGKMLTGRIHVGIVEIETDLEDTFAVALLANSITLTPGTVTLDREGNRLKVIWLDCVTHDPDVAGPAIKGPFEGLLRRVVR